MSQLLYQVRDLIHRYNSQPVLVIEDLTIAPAAIVGLVGPNGSGKSTLLKLLGFVEKPSRGKILFKGRPASPFSEKVRFQVTLLTQEPHLMKRSVYSNVAYGLKIRGDGREIGARVARALSWVGLSAADFAGRQFNELSGGESQRVALAARLVLQPEALLLDEPTASVDVDSARRIREAALTAREKWGTTLVIASHDWQWLSEICDHVFHLYNGRVLGAGVQNVLTGAWIKGEKSWKRLLADGQIIVAPPPDGHAQAAVIDPVDIVLFNQPPQRHDGDNQLYGTLTRLTAEGQSENIVATALIDTVSLTAKLTRRQLNRDRFYPGQSVWLRFDKDAIQWI